MWDAESSADSVRRCRVATVWFKTQSNVYRWTNKMRIGGKGSAMEKDSDLESTDSPATGSVRPVQEFGD